MEGSYAICTKSFLEYIDGLGPKCYTCISIFQVMEIIAFKDLMKLGKSGCESLYTLNIWIMVRTAFMCMTIHVTIIHISLYGNMLIQHFCSTKKITSGRHIVSQRYVGTNNIIQCKTILVPKHCMSEIQLFGTNNIM